MSRHRQILHSLRRLIASHSDGRTTEGLQIGSLSSSVRTNGGSDVSTSMHGVLSGATDWLPPPHGGHDPRGPDSPLHPARPFSTANSNAGPPSPLPSAFSSAARAMLAPLHTRCWHSTGAPRGASKPDGDAAELPRSGRIAAARATAVVDADSVLKVSHCSKSAAPSLKQLSQNL